MDKERLGRALGYGARHAVKTLPQAGDAPTAPSPAERAASPTRRPGGDARKAEAQKAEPQSSGAQAAQAASQTRSRVRSAAKMAGKSALAPVAKFSSVLWLEVTGAFFGLMAMALSQAVWKAHGALKLPPHSPERLKLYGYATVTGLFVYFAVSNFVRARRRQRR